MTNVLVDSEAEDGAAKPPLRAAIHDLKTWPIHFSPVWNGKKRFEWRINDRCFAVGDVLRLKEFDPLKYEYTGRTIYVEVLYMASGDGLGIPPDHVIMSLGSPVCCVLELLL